jgi:hypothetical protein
VAILVKAILVKAILVKPILVKPVKSSSRKAAVISREVRSLSRVQR